jgi:hypothetical protein
VGEFLSFWVAPSEALQIDGRILSYRSSYQVPAPWRTRGLRDAVRHGARILIPFIFVENSK